eukprot:SAG31_NODE_204_length_20414_cov_19.143392_21_plen_196_part_00
MPIDVVDRVALNCGAIRVEAIDRDGVARELSHEPLLAQVCLTPAAQVIALGAADEAALRVPERGLAVEAGLARDVGAGALEAVALLPGARHDEGVDRVARPRVHQRTVAHRAPRETEQRRAAQQAHGFAQCGASAAVRTSGGRQLVQLRPAAAGASESLEKPTRILRTNLVRLQRSKFKYPRYLPCHLAPGYLGT